MKLFNRAAEKIRGSPFIIPIGLVFILMLINSIGLSIEDYSTSLYGYSAFPTQKVNFWVSWLVAMLPQLVQIGMAYVWIDDTDKRWSLLIAGLALLVDLSTDIWYKIMVNGVPNYWYIPIAGLESLVIFTLGSELMLTVAFGMTVKLWPDLTRELSKILNPIKDGLTGLIKSSFFTIFPPEKPQGKNNNFVPAYNAGTGYNQVNVRRNEPGQSRRFDIRREEELDLGEDDPIEEIIIEKKGRGRPPKQKMNF